MKKMPLALLAAFSLSSAAQANVIVFTDQFDWEIGRNTIVSGTQQSQTITDTAHTSGTVQKYGGALDLTRVVIRYLQPNNPVHEDVTGVLSITGGTGSVQFTSATTSASTSFSAGNLAFDVFGISGVNINTVHSDSDFLGLFTLTDTDTRTVEMKYDSTSLWDSADYGAITSSQLNDIFRGPDAFLFGVASSIAFSFERNNTLGIQLQATGMDTGRIEIIYYAIPEPSTYALLFGTLALAGVCARRATRQKCA